MKRWDKDLRPRVAGVITGGVRAGTVRRALAEGAEVLELRVDTFPNLEEGYVIEAAKRLRKLAGGKAVLLTVRSAKEGGKRAIPDALRARIYESLIPFADMVDVELSSSRILGDVVRSAKRLGKKVVISYHNFAGTPGRKTLEGIVSRGRSKGADIVKVATFANSTGDLKRLAMLLISGKDLIVIAMGPVGRPSRVFFPLIGSLLTYGSVGEGTAPGQVPLRELKKEILRYRA